jgi:hypothetical protein
LTENRKSRFQKSFLEMSQPPTEEGLLERLERKGLEKEADDLKNGRTSFDEWMKFTKEDWKEIAGTLNGIAIYNYLHPSRNSSLRSADPNPVQSRRNKLLTFGNSTGTCVPSQFRSSRTETLEAFDRRRSPGNLVYVTCYTII